MGRTITISSTYQPFDVDFMKKNIERLEEKNDLAREKIDTMNEQADQYEKWAKQSGSEEAMKLVNNYRTYADRVKNDLYKNGYNNAIALNLSNARELYNKDFMRAKEAFDAQEALQKSQQEALEKDSSMMFDIDANNVGADWFLKHPNDRVIRSASGNKLASDFGNVISSIAEKLQPGPDGKFEQSDIIRSVADNEYWEQILRYGITPEQAQRIATMAINGEVGANNVENYLIQQLRNTLEANGMNKWEKWNDPENGEKFKQQVYDAAVRGINKAIGKDKSEWRQSKTFAAAVSAAGAQRNSITVNAPSNGTSGGVGGSSERMPTRQRFGTGYQLTDAEANIFNPYTTISGLWKLSALDWAGPYSGINKAFLDLRKDLISNIEKGELSDKFVEPKFKDDDERKQFNDVWANESKQITDQYYSNALQRYNMYARYKGLPQVEGAETPEIKQENGKIISINGVPIKDLKDAVKYVHDNKNFFEFNTRNYVTTPHSNEDTKNWAQRIVSSNSTSGIWELETDPAGNVMFDTNNPNRFKTTDRFKGKTGQEINTDLNDNVFANAGNISTFYVHDIDQVGDDSPNKIGTIIFKANGHAYAMSPNGLNAETKSVLSKVRQGHLAIDKYRKQIENGEGLDEAVKEMYEKNHQNYGSMSFDEFKKNYPSEYNKYIAEVVDHQTRWLTAAADELDWMATEAIDCDMMNRNVSKFDAKQEHINERIADMKDWNDIQGIRKLYSQIFKNTTTGK